MHKTCFLTPQIQSFQNIWRKHSRTWLVELNWCNILIFDSPMKYFTLQKYYSHKIIVTHPYGCKVSHLWTPLGQRKSLMRDGKIMNSCIVNVGYRVVTVFWLNRLFLSSDSCCCWPKKTAPPRFYLYTIEQCFSTQLSKRNPVCPLTSYTVKFLYNRKKQQLKYEHEL